MRQVVPFRGYREYGAYTLQMQALVPLVPALILNGFFMARNIGGKLDLAKLGLPNSEERQRNRRAYLPRRTRAVHSRRAEAPDIPPCSAHPWCRPRQD